MSEYRTNRPEWVDPHHPATSHSTHRSPSRPPRDESSGGSSPVEALAGVLLAFVVLFSAGMGTLALFL